MADPAGKPAKKRRLRKAPETVREQAARSAAGKDKPQPKAKRERPAKQPHRFTQLAIWRPFKFIGRFIIPPYFRSSWRELRLVTWPNWRQSRQLTGAVIIFSIVFGVLVALADYGLDKLFKQVILK